MMARARLSTVLLVVVVASCGPDASFDRAGGGCADDQAFWQQVNDGDGELAGPYVVDGEAEWIKTDDCSLHVVTRFSANDDEGDLTATSIHDSITLWVDQEDAPSAMQTRAVGSAILTPKNAGFVVEQRVCLERFVEQRRRGLTLVVRDAAGNLSNARCLRTFATAENAPDEGLPDDDSGV